MSMKDKRSKKLKKEIARKKAKLATSSDSDGESEHELFYYANDRVQLMKQVLKILKCSKIKSLAPNLLKNSDMEEINAMLLEELLGISNKRLKKILQGQNADDESSSSSEDEAGKPIDIISLDDISDDEDFCFVDEGPSEKNKRDPKNDKSKNSKKPKLKGKVKEEPKSEKLEDSEKLLSVLELLELQARARAIRSQLVLEAEKKQKESQEKVQESDGDDDDAVIVETPKEPNEIVISSSDSEKEKEKAKPKKKSQKIRIIRTWTSEINVDKSNDTNVDKSNKTNGADKSNKTNVVDKSNKTNVDKSIKINIDKSIKTNVDKSIKTNVDKCNVETSQETNNGSKSPKGKDAEKINLRKNSESQAEDVSRDKSKSLKDKRDPQQSKSHEDVSRGSRDTSESSKNQGDAHRKKTNSPEDVSQGSKSPENKEDVVRTQISRSPEGILQESADKRESKYPKVKRDGHGKEKSNSPEEVSQPSKDAQKTNKIKLLNDNLDKIETQHVVKNLEELKTSNKKEEIANIMEIPLPTSEENQKKATIEAQKSIIGDCDGENDVLHLDVVEIDRIDE